MVAIYFFPNHEDQEWGRTESRKERLDARQAKTTDILYPCKYYDIFHSQKQKKKKENYQKDKVFSGDTKIKSAFESLIHLPN